MLQEIITLDHFYELTTYDRIWGLDRHCEIDPPKPDVDPEQAIRTVKPDKERADDVDKTGLIRKRINVG